jgi:ribosomal-protein-alanine N-acetyltransferase
MPITTPVITTSRLILFPLEIADAEAIQQLFPKWEILQFMTNQIPWPYPADGALTFIRDIALPAMRQGTAWHWSIRPKRTPEQLIGVISLRDKTDENRGFWLDTAVTDYWFETLERPILRVPKAAANVASRRISERSGMRVIKTEDRDYVSGRFSTEIWEITREEWFRRSR